MIFVALSKCADENGIYLDGFLRCAIGEILSSKKLPGSSSYCRQESRSVMSRPLTEKFSLLNSSIWIQFFSGGISIDAAMASVTGRTRRRFCSRARSLAILILTKGV
jgi:hypothetical protein